nr:protein TPX2-like isoform X2 [Ipomoea batatas]
MDDDMDYFVEVEQDECHKPSEIDLDYEFDAARFFDFSRSETIFEIIEAELWFHASGNYPPSPLIIKTNWGSGTSSEQKTADKSKAKKEIIVVDISEAGEVKIRKRERGTNRIVISAGTFWIIILREKGVAADPLASKLLHRRVSLSFSQSDSPRTAVNLESADG